MLKAYDDDLREPTAATFRNLVLSEKKVFKHYDPEKQTKKLFMAIVLQLNIPKTNLV